MNIVIDFLEGRTSFEEFWNEWLSSPELQKWLDQLVDLKSEIPDEWLQDKEYCGTRIVIHKYYNGAASKFINSSQYPSRHSPKCLFVAGTYNSLAAVVKLAYPEIRTISRYDLELDYYNYAVPYYIGGDEVTAFIENILAKYPSSLGKTKRKSLGKAAIKEAFHVEGNKFPRWIQEPEWPMGIKQPMKFISQNRKGELVTFRFVDLDTGEEKAIEQLY